VPYHIVSLGYATNLFDCYTRTFGESIPVDWAIALGSADGTEGSLEYAGARGVVCATSPIVLKGEDPLQVEVGKSFGFGASKLMFSPVTG
jgi:hypothetical protein